MTRMLQRVRTLRDEFSPMTRLAIPVVMAELGWVTMGLVDTLMVGPLGPEAIGAVGLGSSVFIGVIVFAMGLLLGMDTLVSHAFGGGRLEDCHRWLGRAPLQKTRGPAEAPWLASPLDLGAAAAQPRERGSWRPHVQP